MIQGLYPIFNHWHSSGTVWIFADPHFNDTELAEGIPDRPSAEAQIKLINSKVGKNDALIILGDVGDIDCVRCLKGYKILVCGNHDLGATNYQKQTRRVVYDTNQYSRQEALEAMREAYPKWNFELSYACDIHPPFEMWVIHAENGLFDEVYTGPLMISDKLILSHEPIDVPWAFNIHGHVHDPKAKEKNNQFNVCADVIGYTPINFNQWMKQGYLKNTETIHRKTIDKATARKNKIRS